MSRRYPSVDVRLNTDLRKFFASVALRHFGLALITLFVPAFLYKELGFSLHEVLSYFALQEGLAAVLVYASGLFIYRHGTKKAMLLSIPFAFLAYFLLPLAKDPSILLVVAFSRSLFSSFYYVSFHVYLARSAPKGKVGESTGKTWFTLSLAILFAPLLGGLLLEYVNYAFLFALMVILQVLSVFLLPSFKHRESRPAYGKLFSRTSWKEKLSWVGQGLEIEAGDFLWPLFAFLVVESYAPLGALKFGASILSAGFAWWVGKRTDVIKREAMLFYSWVLGAITWLFRWRVNDLGTVFAGNVLGDMAFSAMESPIMYRVYSDGVKGNDLIARIAVRESLLRVAYFPILLVAWFVPLSELFLVLGIAFAVFALAYRA